MKKIQLYLQSLIFLMVVLSGTVFWWVFEAAIPALALPTQWQLAYALAMVAIAGFMTWYARPSHSGLMTELEPIERQRLLHDFPFKLARLCVGLAILLAVSMMGAQLSLGRPTTSAVIAGVLAYLLAVIPILWFYLGVRRALRRVEAIALIERPPNLIRQGIRMRLMFAIQAPLVTSACALLLVTYTEHVEQSEYAHRQSIQQIAELQRFSNLSDHTSTFVDSNKRPLTTITRADDASAQFGEQGLTEHLLGILSLIGLIWLSSYYVRSLTGDITTDLKTVRAGIQKMRRPRTEPNGPMMVGFRETDEIFEGFEIAVSHFETQRQRIADATVQRARADQQKTSFLTHVSHELKSPLNSILGFSELMLAGIDGPLSTEQVTSVSRIWWEGDRLFRFIVGLIDICQIDGLVRFNQLSTLPSFHRSTGRIEELLLRLKELHRPHPLAKVTFDIDTTLDEQLNLGPMYMEHTIRCILLLIGTLSECLEDGSIHANFQGHTSKSADLKIKCSGRPRHADAFERLMHAWSESENYRIDYLRSSMDVAPLALMRQLCALQATSISFGFDGGEAYFVVRLPIVNATTVVTESRTKEGLSGRAS